MDTSLLPLWRRSNTQEQSVSSSGTPRMGMKTSSSRTRKSSPMRSSTTARMTRFMLKHPVRQRRKFQGCRGVITLPKTWFGGRCAIRGWNLFIFAGKERELMPESIKRMCYKELWNLLTQLSSMVRNGSSSRTQLLSTRPRWLRSGWRGTFQHLSVPRIGSQGIQTPNPLDYKLWAVLEEMACRKNHNNMDSLKRSLVKAAAEILLKTVRAVIAEWPERLRACTMAEGSHFEWHYYK